ncbi:MAG: cbb3-type cytochrome oxidase assembly protein CcoS [Magnetococcales bacterium]|nr:cbb3-type cytochrome oxidase assembly protein CcoS [Magnetococcales bacterium]
MNTLYLLIPAALLLGLIGLGLMLWAVRNGQFEDLEGPAHRILFDDDQDQIPAPPCTSTREEGEA